MRKIAIISALIAIALNAYCQLDRDALEKERMRQHGIKECTQLTHKYHKDKPDPKGYKTTVTQYDRDGNPTLIINYRANGEESSRLYYSYDGQGRRVEYRKEETLGGKKMRLSFSQKFTYDNRGNKRSEEGFDGSSSYRLVYSYLPNGKLTNIIRYKADNTVSERWIYAYEGNKQIVRVTPKSGDPYTIEKLFDDAERLLSEVQFDSKGSPQREITYSYDKNGRIVNQTESYAGQKRYELKYRFDANGQLVQVIQTAPDGNEFVNNDYSYDSEGNLVTEKWVDGDPSLISKKDSEFDPKGNRVRVDSYYAPYRYRVMYSYQYKKY